MPGVIYILCAATCLLCAVMLFRGYASSRVRLLFWSGLCFTFLIVDNLMLYVDRIVFPDIDLSLWRTLPGLVATALLLIGLIWEAD
jgi:Family of unknown function (DUF5985)